MGQQLLDLAVDELPALGQLVAGAVREVLPDVAGLGLARAAGEVAVLDEVGEPGVDRVGVELEALLRQAVDHLGRRLVGEEALMPSVNSRMIAR